MAEAASITVSKEFPRAHEKFIQYGTAGFRTRGEDLPHVICRMGLLAVLRSKMRQATIGVMITASHNPEEDNGVKLVDPLGEMLEVCWEKYATAVANARDSELAESLSSIVNEENINMEAEARVYFARDTRPSSRLLAQALEVGIKAMNANFKDFGLLTTPQLHYMVRCRNTAGQYGTDTEDGYYSKLSAAFLKLNKQVSSTGKYSSDIYLDAANGVGAAKMKKMASYLGEALSVHVVNDGAGKLNYKCGADYVKVGQCAPEGIQMTPGMKYASFDGDADRLVYFYRDQAGTFHLFDGDRIATIVASFLQTLVKGTGLDVTLGLVQTAYANGNSTNYISQTLKVPVACVATGVKHLHHKAHDFDIGVYFEANGHGTVLFSEEVQEKIQQAATDMSLTDSQQQSAATLQTVIDLINQTVGDAISDLLLVEAILCYNGWDLDAWRHCYTDLPNRQLKVKVKDRCMIKTTPDERQATSPVGLQAAIDKCVSKFDCGRSFVRPSGTEDVVRVYAEADRQATADQLGFEVSLLVYNMAGGEGDRPSLPYVC